MSRKVHNKVSKEWEAFVRSRLNDLHAFAYSDTPYGYGWDPQTILANRLAYFAYHKLLNDWGFGRDLTQHPNNPFQK